VSKPTIPQVLPAFVAYREIAGNGCWGSLHIVLEDNNVEDHSVRFCIEWAEEHDDMEGADLARLLLKMSRSQRSRLSSKVDEYQRLAAKE